MELPYHLELVIGDSSGDGHGRTSSETYRTNLDGRKVEAGYRKGTEILGFDFVTTVAREYSRDSNIAPEHWYKLIEHGCPHIDEDDDRVWRDAHASIYLWIAQLGEPTLVFEPGRSNVFKINVGGYAYY